MNKKNPSIPLHSYDPKNASVLTLIGANRKKYFTFNYYLYVNLLGNIVKN